MQAETRIGYPYPEVEQRLGDPDYSGIWGSAGHIAGGSFRMFILSRKPTTEKDNVYGERVEGVITDQHGLAVFSGIIGNDLSSHKNIIKFTKSYSVENTERINYKGELDENLQVYVGEWSILGTKVSAGFQLRQGR